MSRMSGVAEFWPHYLSEHSHPVSRLLHFVGTTGFFVAAVAALITRPATFGPGLGVALLALAWGVSMDRERPAFLPMAVVVGALLFGAPLVMAGGIVGAYGMAWIGHFGFERNRPATFVYPAWSLVSDFRLWSEMVRGRRWA